MMRNRFLAMLIFVSAIFGGQETVSACTTAIITGKATPDGRPLLYKHRDSGFTQNKLMFFDGDGYSFIGLINSEDQTGEEVWIGSNSAGFAIMNSASYNLAVDDTIRLKDQEGVIMKAALGRCATLADFEKLLDEWPKPLGVEANFGVIDAQGGAAYYETNNFSYTKIDANDPAVAPFGYLIRTNYSFTGSADDGYGYIRYLNAENLFYQAAAEHALTHRFLLQKVSRNLYHSLVKTDLSAPPFPPAGEEKFVHFLDYTPRFSSVTSTVIQGVKANESPDLVTIWTILGFPLSSVTVPVWVAGGAGLPAIMVPDQSGNAPLCDKSLMLKKQVFPISRGSGYKYMNLSALLNAENTGIMQKLVPLENQILESAESFISSHRAGGFGKSEIANYYKMINEEVLLQYKNLFGI